MLKKYAIFAVLSLFCFLAPSLFAEGIIFDQEDVENFNYPFSSIEGLEFIQKDKMPKHISFIMDGNRRWAKKRGLSEIEGHAKGGDALIRLIKFFCNVDLGIDTITLYAFSTENWKRSEREVNLLMDLFISYFDEITPYLQTYAIRLETIGDTTKLPLNLQRKLEKIKNFPIENPRYTLVVALNYGGRDEIKRAFFKMACDLEEGLFAKEDISEELIQSYLDTGFLKDPELMIRTSGEQRISNFLLWQLAYSEFYFSPLLWPDLSEQELVNILLDYQNRDRRFGGGK